MIRALSIVASFRIVACLTLDHLGPVCKSVYIAMTQGYLDELGTL